MSIKIIDVESEGGSRIVMDFVKINPDNSILTFFCNLAR